MATLPPGVPARPLAILLALGAVALLGSLAGLPGLAIVAGLLLAPAALVLNRVRDWLLPALAPALGLIGAAPAFLAVAARRERVAERAALAGLAWVWTGVAGELLGRALGVPIGAGDVAGWASSGPIAIDGMIAPLLSPTAIAIALTWIGGAVLLGALLDVASPAGAAVGGLVWAGAIAALLGAAGDGAAPTMLLAPALIVAVGWAIWDRAGRPDPAPDPRAPCASRNVRSARRRSRLRSAPRSASRGPDRPPAAQPRRPAPRRRAHPCDPDGAKARARGAPRRRFAGRVAVALRPRFEAWRVWPGSTNGLQHERSTQSRSEDRGPRRRRLQPRLQLPGAAGGDRPQARQGDGLAQDRLGLADLRAEQLHGLALARGPRAARGLHALALPGALRLPARARPPAGLRAADPARGEDRGRRPPPPRRVRDPAAARQAAGPQGRHRRAGSARPHDGLLGSRQAEGAPRHRAGRRAADPDEGDRLLPRPPLRARRPDGRRSAARASAIA